MNNASVIQAIALNSQEKGAVFWPLADMFSGELRNSEVVREKAASNRLTLRI